MNPRSDKWIGSSQDNTTDAKLYFVNALTHYPSPTVLSNMPHYSIAIEFITTPFFNILTDLKGESIGISLTEENRSVNVTDILSALGE